MTPTVLAEPTPAEAAPEGLAAVLAHRRADLVAYQNEAYAQSYERFVLGVAAAEADGGHGQALSLAVAENLYKLMAIKDEYEVARLHTDGSFERRLAEMFEQTPKVRYHLAPPALSLFGGGTAKPRKRAFGPWLRPLLRLLAHGRRLRGTIADPFGWSAERRREQALASDYRAMIEGLLDRLEVDTYATAIELARLPDTIRGFGHVKERAIEAYETRRRELLARLEAVEGGPAVDERQSQPRVVEPA